MSFLEKFGDPYACIPPFCLSIFHGSLYAEESIAINSTKLHELILMWIYPKTPKIILIRAYFIHSFLHFFFSSLLVIFFIFLKHFFFLFYIWYILNFHICPLLSLFFRWIHQVHTFLGKLLPWGKMFLMQRHFLRRGTSVHWCY